MRIARPRRAEEPAALAAVAVATKWCKPLSPESAPPASHHFHTTSPVTFSDLQCCFGLACPRRISRNCAESVEREKGSEPSTSTLAGGILPPTYS
jgi:hypothetical protein